MNKVVVLFSGGMDSLMCLACAKFADNEVHALSVNYGQRHVKELERAREICRRLEIKHVVLEYKGLTFAQSALTSDEFAVVDRKENGLPAAELPGRNFALIALANSYAQSIGAKSILIGCCASDEAGFPDCRPDFMIAVASAVRLNSANDLSLSAPALYRSKAEIKQVCVEAFGQDIFDLTWSCYQGQAEPCECCPACLARNTAAL